MKIKFLQDFNGDSIWISFLKNDIPRNILIDGGVGKTYKSTSNIKGELHKVIEKLLKNKLLIDLLILTQYDDNHIGGVLRRRNNVKEVLVLLKRFF